MDVGLIGLGRMGAGIAKSLLRGGHRVTVHNRTRERAEALRKDGAAVADSVADACHGDAVLTMLADDAAVESVVFSDNGVLKSLAHGGVHISLSTISVALSDRLEAEHIRAGQDFIAAPVFGRPEAAEAGKLAIVAAGPSTTVERCKPLWEAIGQKVLVIGEQPSKANVVKLTGNFLIATVLESLGEALAFARKSGVDAVALLDFLTSTLFNAPVYKTYGGLKSVLVRKSNSATASTPDLRANARASPSDSSTVAIRKFPVSLTTFALDGCSPITSTFCPMASHKGLHRSTVVLGPAATMANFPASAASGRPNTGAAIKSCPARACSVAKRSLSATLMVLSEMCTPPCANDFSTPLSLNTTDSTAASSASIVSTASPWQASATESATAAPSLRSASARLRVRLSTILLCSTPNKRCLNVS